MHRPVGQTQQLEGGRTSRLRRHEGLWRQGRRSSHQGRVHHGLIRHVRAGREEKGKEHKIANKSQKQEGKQIDIPG